MLPFDFPYFDTVMPAGSMVTAHRGVVAFGARVDVPAANVALPADIGDGAIAGFWDADTPPLETCLRTARPDLLEIEWLGFPDSTIETVVARLTPNGIVEVTIHMDGIHEGPFMSTMGLEPPDHDSAVSLPCSPACTAADVFPGMTTRYVPADVELGAILVPVCVEAADTRRYRDEPPSFVRYRNLGDEVSLLRRLWSFDAAANTLGGDPNDDILRPLDSGGDFIHQVDPISPGDTGDGVWIGDARFEYGGFRHDGVVHVVLGGYPDLVYAGEFIVEPYADEPLVVEATSLEADVGTPINIVLTATPDAERWSASYENDEWLTLTSDGRVRGAPPMSGMFEASGFAHRRGHPPAEGVARIRVFD